MKNKRCSVDQQINEQWKLSPALLVWSREGGILLFELYMTPSKDPSKDILRLKGLSHEIFALFLVWLDTDLCQGRNLWLVLTSVWLLKFYTELLQLVRAFFNKIVFMRFLAYFSRAVFLFQHPQNFRIDKLIYYRMMIKVTIGLQIFFGKIIGPRPLAEK
jgi:hypothetical protein